MEHEMRMTRAIRTATLAAAATLALTVAAAPAASAGGHEHGHGHGQGVTRVVLNPDVVPVLVQDLKVRPIKPGTLTTTKRGKAVLAFPITDVQKNRVEHAGGLRFTPVGGGSLRITGFDVELKRGVLDAHTRLNGKRLGEVDIFDLGKTQRIHGKKTPCNGIAAGLYLSEEAAGALNAPQFEGVFIGNACVKPSRH